MPQSPIYKYLFRQTLTLKQLRELIQDMYAQKSKYDEKCADNKLPRETMEQYMYTYLNQIYGLKSLIIEGATGIINGIKKYSKSDSDVALFGKILRNEVDEDFRLVFNEAKLVMNDLLRDKLKKKFKNKSEPEITKMVRDIQQNDIEEYYYLAIIRHMYIEEDSLVLEQQIKEKIAELQTYVAKPDSSKGLTREQRLALQTRRETKIPYKDFQKIVLDFQLTSHEQYSRKFSEMFKRIDADTDGILNEVQFRQLIDEIGVYEAEADVLRLLQKIDPYNHQKISYSDCFALFKTEGIPIDLGNTPESTNPTQQYFFIYTKINYSNNDNLF